MGNILYDKLKPDERRIYDLIKKSFITYSPIVNLGSGVSGEKCQSIVYAVLADNPDIYYFDKTELAIGYDFFKGHYLKLQRCYKPSEAKSRQIRVESKIRGIIGEIEEMCPIDDYEKALLVYAYLQSHFSYDQEEFEFSCQKGRSVRPDSHNAYGVLVDGKGVCDGFTSAFSLIIQNCGIPCTGVSGRACFNTTTASDHQWNIIKINNQYVHCDVTWDLDDYNSFKEYSFKYFCVNDMYASKTHFWDRVLVPVCDTKSLSYFVKKGLIVYSNDQLDRIVGLIAKSRKNYFQIHISDSFIFDNSMNESEYLIKRIQEITLKYRNSVSLSYKWDPDIRCLTCRYN